METQTPEAVVDRTEPIYGARKVIADTLLAEFGPLLPEMDRSNLDWNEVSTNFLKRLEEDGYIVSSYAD